MTPDRCPVWWCDQLADHEWQHNGPGRTRVQQAEIGSYGVRVMQSENDAEPWSKVTVDLDLGETDDPQDLRVIAQDITAAALLLERIRARGSVT
jgi:hypothetical protein